MHPLTRVVAHEATALEFRQFQEPDDRERIMAIRDIALEQVDDDRDSMSGGRAGRAGLDRIGREYVIHADPDDGTGLWRRWTPDRMNLEDAMAPLVRELSDKQQDATHLLFWGNLTERQAAAVMTVSRQAVRIHRDRGLVNLRRAIKARYSDDFSGQDARSAAAPLPDEEPAPHNTFANGPELVPAAFASVRYDPKLRNALRFGYRVPDREASA